jgi:hypothetical protein
MLRGRFGQVNEDKQVEWNTEGQLGRVEVWRGGLGAAYLFPALSSAGASLAGPCSVSTCRVGPGSFAPSLSQISA